MLLLIPGPVQTRPEVKAAMAQDIAPWDDDFRAVIAEIRERVRDLAGGLPGEHAALPLQGCGHFIMEAAIRSFVPPAGKLLIPLNGSYAERAWRLAREVGRGVVPLAVPDTRGVRPEEIAAALAADPAISHVVAVYSETGSGIVNDIPTIGAAVRAAGRRLIVDAVSAFGALPFDLAAQPECDAVLFTSGKCLEGMPGIAFAVAPVARLEGRAGQAGSWSLDLADIYAHALRAGWGTFRFTPAVQALAAFQVALDLHAAEGGAPARLARYRENARLLHEGVAALGLRPYVAVEHQGPIIVTVHQPGDPAFTLPRFVSELKARGVLISNFFNTRAPTFRLGAIGALGSAEMRQVMGAIAAALAAMGVRQMAPAVPPDGVAPGFDREIED